MSFKLLLTQFERPNSGICGHKLGRLLEYFDQKIVGLHALSYPNVYSLASFHNQQHLTEKQRLKFTFE